MKDCVRGGTSDDNHTAIFEFCAPKNPSLEYKQQVIAPYFQIYDIVRTSGHLGGHVEF